MRKNTIAASLGRKGMGKSELLHELFTSQAPRVLSFNPAGESVERDPDVVEVYGWTALLDTLRQCRSYPRWHIAASLEPEDVIRLLELMVPPMGSDKPSLSKSLGGLAIECGEAYDIWANPAPRPALRAIRQSRHAALDLFLGTQRPSSVAREVTALADKIFAFAQTEPADIAFLAKTISRPVADRVRRLKKWECVYFDRDTNLAQVLDPERNVVEQFNTFGESDQTAFL